MGNDQNVWNIFVSNVRSLFLVASYGKAPEHHLMEMKGDCRSETFFASLVLNMAARSPSRRLRPSVTTVASMYHMYLL